jgi:hypothetical protein
MKGIGKVSILNKPIAANTNFISTDPAKTPPLKPTNTPCIFRIYVCLSVAGNFSVQRKKASQATTEYMDQNVALAANSAYMFDILVDEDETIDFQTTVAATIIKFSVVEVDEQA